MNNALLILNLVSRKGKLQIGGFHHDYMNAFEKNGLLEFRNKKYYQDGFYSAEIYYKGYYVKKITFFPAHWTRKQVVNSIYEAYENFIKSSAEPILNSDNKYLIIGTLTNGIEIVMFVTKKGKITTSYPDLKQESKWNL